MGVIYKITSPTNKIYVGKTYDLRKRINSHKYSAKKKGNIMLHNSIRKYGWDAHYLEVIETIADELLDEREMYWIKELNSFYRNNEKGMNMTLGGDGQRNTWMDNLERRKKASIYFTENAPFKGRKHTEENKKIIAEKASKRNKERKITIPKWGAEKGRLKVIRACIVYNNNGDFIGEHESLTNCSKVLGIKLGSVKDSVIYGSWALGKYLIKYKTTDDYPKKIEVGVIKLQTVKRPVICIFRGGKRKKYPSAAEAALDLNVPKTTINRAAQYNNGRPIRKGYIFLYD
jgi:group I intron endonuclease